MASPLRLRPPRLEDEAVARAPHDALRGDGFDFLLGYDGSAPWSAYVAEREANRTGRDLPERWVPSTFLLAFVDGALVGRASIRHELNEFLLGWGGHVGYAVLPEHRRRGYATEILRQSIVVARSYGVDGVLVTCDDQNVGSARVIERCGGVLENVVDGPDPGERTRRYWIGGASPAASAPATAST